MSGRKNRKHRPGKREAVEQADTTDTQAVEEVADLTEEETSALVHEEVTPEQPSLLLATHLLDQYSTAITSKSPFRGDKMRTVQMALYKAISDNLEPTDDIMKDTLRVRALIDLMRGNIAYSDVNMSRGMEDLLGNGIPLWYGQLTGLLYSLAENPKGIMDRVNIKRVLKNVPEGKAIVLYSYISSVN